MFVKKHIIGIKNQDTVVPPAQSNMSVGHNYLVSDVLCWLLQNYGSKVFITCSLDVLNLWKSIKVMLSHFICAIFVDLATSVHKIQPVLQIEANFGVRVTRDIQPYSHN